MTKEEIFYNNFKVTSYELSMETLMRCDKSIANIFYVKWNSKVIGPIKQEITQDEYKILMDVLNTKAGAVATMNAYIADGGRVVNPATLDPTTFSTPHDWVITPTNQKIVNQKEELLNNILTHTKPAWCDRPYPCAECDKAGYCVDKYNTKEEK